MKALLLTALTSASVSAGVRLDLDRIWERISDPVIMSSSFEKKFANLPLGGALTGTGKFWSSDYWARNKGGINYRWNAPMPTGFGYRSPTYVQATSMTQEQLATLAPSEKWDLFNGRYSYPTTREVARYASPERPVWEGICDGWAGAALNHREPLPVTGINPDGLQIPFGSSDIKAILSWYYAKKYSGGYAMMGRRCYGRFFGVERCGQDMNAGAFHVVLTNRIGLNKEGLIADIDRGAEVWNHLPSSFKTTILAEGLAPRPSSAPGSVSLTKVKTVVKYVWLLTKNRWQPVLGTSFQRTRSQSYEYYLDLDEAGRIIGGEWISAIRPDFLWLERKAPVFSASFSRLSELLQDSKSVRQGEGDGDN